MEHEVLRFCMTKPDSGLTPSLPATDPASTAAWGSKRINPRPSSVCVWPGVNGLPNDNKQALSFKCSICHSCPLLLGLLLGYFDFFVTIIP